MVVRKTLVRQGRTLAHGTFQIHETEYVCGAGCLSPSGTRIRRRSSTLEAALLPNSSVGYDVMVFVGVHRFLRHRQREEIRGDLARDYDVALSAGEVSRLARLFLSYLETLHSRRREQIRAVLERDGGWPLHVDATGEDGRGTLLVLYAGWRRWVLGAQKIPTECAEAVLPLIEDVVGWAGRPCAVVRDLGKAMILACDDFRKAVGGELPILSCHYHFLADVGKDLLRPGYGELRALFRRTRIRPQLGALVRDLGRKLGEEIPHVRGEILAWQEERETGHRLPEGHEGLGVVRALAQWVLDYRAESTGQDFPFVLPYLDFYDRCVVARRALDAFLRKPPRSRAVSRALERLARILGKARGEVPFQAVTANLRQRQALFDELRDALRLETGGSDRRDLPDTERAVEEIGDIEKAVGDLVVSLEKRRPQRGPARATRDAIDLVLDHLDRHGESLWGHVIHLPEQAGGGIRVVDRTNDILENFFHGMKHGERRRSGRKILTQDFEALPSSAALAQNLHQPDYVATVCGSLEDLPRAFAELDAEDRERRLAADGSSSQPASPLPRMQTTTASLPIEDRRVIRTDSMNKRIRRAAASRAPRTGPQVAATG